MSNAPPAKTLNLVIWGNVRWLEKGRELTVRGTSHYRCKPNVLQGAVWTSSAMAVTAHHGHEAMLAGKIKARWTFHKCTHSDSGTQERLISDCIQSLGDLGNICQDLFSLKARGLVEQTVSAFSNVQDSAFIFMWLYKYVFVFRKKPVVVCFYYYYY